MAIQKVEIDVDIPGSWEFDRYDHAINGEYYLYSDGVTRSSYITKEKQIIVKPKKLPTKIEVACDDAEWLKAVELKQIDYEIKSVEQFNESFIEIKGRFLII